MIYAYNTESQTLAANQPVVFEQNGVISGACTSHAVGSERVYLNRTGYYQVHVTADGVEGGTPGNISLQLYANGVPVPGAEATAYSAGTSSVMNLSFDALIKVKPNCIMFDENLPTVLTVENIGVGATYTNASITVNKIG